MVRDRAVYEARAASPGQGAAEAETTMKAWMLKQWRMRVRRTYWIVSEDVDDQHHMYPNRDLIRHEAVDCPCGPSPELYSHGDGDCWHYTHHSLDAREAQERS
jgi:hypothetical protein